MISPDHRDILSRASDTLQAVAHWIDDEGDVNMRGTAWVLTRIADDLDRIEAEAQAELHRLALAESD